MSKSKNKKIWFLIFFSLLYIGSYGFSFAPIDGINTALSQRQGKTKDREQQKYFQSEKVNTKLFLSNLNNTHNERISPLTKALQETQQYINAQYDCWLSLKELSAILTFSNENFKSELIQQLYEQGSNIANTLPKLSDKQNACKKLSKCQLPKNRLTSISATDCENLITPLFLQSWQAAIEIDQAETANFWANIYQNGDTKDAEFDLLFDISQIVKILFEGFKEQPEIVFYRMPTFNKSEENTQTTDNQKTNLAQNPQNNSQNASSRQDNQNTQIQKNWSQNWDSSLSPRNNIQATSEDDEINTFLQKTIGQTAYGRNNALLFQNQCIVIDESENENTTQINQSPFPATQNTLTLNNTLNTLKSTNTSRLPQDKNQKQTPPSNTNETSIIGGTDQSSIEKTAQELQACIQKCEARNKEGTYHYPYDERQICKLTCLCGEFSSPALYGSSEAKAQALAGADISELIEEGALRIRFCTIPSEAISPNTTQKNIYSYSEVLNEIQKVLTTLYNSGKLSVKVEATEVLQGNNSPEEKFSKTTSVTIQTSTQKPTQTISETDLKEENKSFFKQLQETATLSKNALVLIASPESNLQNSIQNENTNVSPLPKAQPAMENIKLQDISLSRKTLAESNLIISNFLDHNQEVLQQLQKALEQSNTLLKSFKKQGE